MTQVVTLTLKILSVKNYELFPNVVIRTPLLPIATVINKDGFQYCDLQRYFQAPEILEALYLASPTLYEECLKWHAGTITDEKESRKLERTLVKYLSRMSTRCTPFGLFAGFHLANWDREAGCIIDSSQNRRKTRLDMSYLCALSRHINKNEVIRKRVKFYPNSTLYNFGTSLRYIECKYHGTTRKFEISSVDYSEYTNKVLQAARHGAYFNELIEILAGGEITLTDAKEFLDEIIENQLIVSELEPSVTGTEFLDTLITKLHQFNNESSDAFIKSTLSTLENVRRELNDLDESEIGIEIRRYKSIRDNLQVIGVPIDNQYLFQVDLVKGYESNVLDSKIAAQIRKGIAALNMFGDGKNQKLTQFAESFRQRYESKEVPLLLALDNESGVGYNSTNIMGNINLEIDEVITPSKPQGLYTKRTPTIDLIHRKYLSSIKNGDYAIKLTEQDLKDLGVDTHQTDLADTISVIVRSISTDSGCNLFLRFAGTGSASGLIGRFTNVDVELDNYAKSITKYEEDVNPDKILAEIVHLPEDRVGNVLIRSHVRKYEIPILCNSNLEKAYQIPLSDLAVSVSAQGTISLRSFRLNKEVIPRMATAHNFEHRSLPIYHFLADLQFQNCQPGFAFMWEKIPIEHPFKPRVEFGNIILERACWTFADSQLKQFSSLTGQALINAITKWRIEWMIPRYIVILDEDYELFIDLENELFLMVLIDRVKKKQTITLTEFLMPSDMVTDSAKNIFSNELIIAFKRKKNIINQPSKGFSINSKLNESKQENIVKRTFVIGSEWLYFKVYLGYETAEWLLATVMPNIISDLTTKNLIVKWFFVRYEDPEFHLRIRFQIEGTGKIEIILTLLRNYFDWLITNNSIYRLQTDTYEREIERYTSECIEPVEKLFHLQSEEVVQFIKEIDNENADSLKLLYSIYVIVRNLNLFKLQPDAKYQFVQITRDAFAIEFQANINTNKIITTKYKKYHAAIEALVNDNFDQSPALQYIHAVTQYFMNPLESISAEIINTVSELNHIELKNILGSINHMHINKIAKSKSRKQEFICYDLIRLHYQRTLMSTQLLGKN